MIAESGNEMAMASFSVNRAVPSIEPFRCMQTSNRCFARRPCKLEIPQRADTTTPSAFKQSRPPTLSSEGFKGEPTQTLPLAIFIAHQPCREARAYF